ncbi:EsaB/YukD family protein [Streptacidiphilus sp. ASG 303]|uniref:EsaB/YukD family protein n=1 Tax=Streptacidiphilus sp. ASG 303 TaxID=2896847 RepID=UPI001E4DC45E|nr:EsaB/YukD family protein [Streptacidiphilus sp. ASG 303]
MTVVGELRRVDIAVPARAAIAEYTPELLRLCGQDDSAHDALPAAWSLSLPGAAPLPPTASLAEAGILDGATLYLTDVLSGEFDEPVVTDLEEQVAEAAVKGVWDVRLRALTATVLALAGIVAGLAALALSESPAPVLAALCTAAGLLLAAGAGHATRRGWSLPVGVRLTAAFAAVPLCGLAAFCLPAARSGDGSGPAFVVAGVFLGALVARLVVPHAVGSAVLALALLVFALSTFLASVAADLQQSASAVAVVASAVLAAAPTLAGQIAALGLTPERGSEVRQGTDTDVPGLVRTARLMLVGISWLCAALLVPCLVVLGTADGPYAPAFAVCMSLSLLLSAGRLTLAAAVLPPLAAGVCGLTATALHLPRELGAPGWTGPSLVLLAALPLLALGTVRAFSAADEPAERPSWPDSLAWFLSLACIPLSMGLFGMFTYLLALGESL